MRVTTKKYAGFGAFGDCPTEGSWEEWCDCRYGPVAPAIPGIVEKCKSKPFPGGLFPPWTNVGANARGLPDAKSVEKVMGQVAARNAQQAGINASYQKAASDIAVIDAKRAEVVKKVALYGGAGLVVLTILGLVAKLVSSGSEDA